MPQSKEKIADSLKKLEKIVKWFQDQEDIDVEEGLKMVKEGAGLIKNLQGALDKVENEFKEIKRGLDVDND